MPEATERPYILHMFTSTPQMSPFDVNMAADAGYQIVVPYCNVDEDSVVQLTQDAIFSRGPKGVSRTGIFIGGLIGATAFILYAIATSVDEARAALRVDPSNIAMLGLGASALGGIGAGFAGDPFLTGQWLFLFRDGDSYLPLSTVLIFDIGVYMAVFGGILTLVFALEQEI